MRVFDWQRLKSLGDLLRETAPTPDELALRLKTVERDIILPVKAVFILILLYNLLFSQWFEDVALPRSRYQEAVEQFFIIYLFINVCVAFVLIRSHRFKSIVVARVIFASNFLDGLFVAALAFVTGGFDSILYWAFPGLIMRNALSSPQVVNQLLLNLSATFWYLCAGLLDLAISDDMLDYDDEGWGNPTEPLLLRFFVLLLMTACCYGVQVLLEKQRKAEDEAREFGARQEGLRSAGRLAAQIAHQIKNPLAIINNAAFSLQRSLTDGKESSRAQVQIIREEIERADQIITKLMGYAQLAEGKVEKLDIVEELERAITAVFPPGAQYPIAIHKDFSLSLPHLLMQRSHLSEILVNVLLNAREAVNGNGQIHVQAALDSDNAVLVSIKDNGPGIPADRLEKIFHPYFSTKPRGTGLGLAIVRQNTEIYSGTVRVESELGKSTTFHLVLPTRTFMKLRK
jgi:signal transduction histidine kinase